MQMTYVLRSTSCLVPPSSQHCIKKHLRILPTLYKDRQLGPILVSATELARFHRGGLQRELIVHKFRMHFW